MSASQVRRGAWLCLCAIAAAFVGWMFWHGDRRAVDAPSLVAATAPLTPEEQLKTFHLPPGFKIELVAAEPEVPKPINLSFDSHGRLYVSCSVGYPIRATAQGEAQDKIVVLSDSDGDGKFDRPRTLVDGLNMPIGLTAIEGGAVFHAIPRICHWSGDAERPETGTSRPLYGTFGYQDTHGMVSSLTPWIDGWIYACHGVGNVSTVSLADGRSIVLRGGNTFRMRADGSDLEYVTHGQVNPFGLTFDPLGNLFSADSTTLPAYQLLRGASYPSGECGGFDAIGVGPAMMSHKHGSSCIAGIVYYAADAFPAAYRDTLFIGNPVTGRINHDRLERHGTTMLAIERPDFLTCDDPWFRPVDLKLGPDGALYVADFYNAVIGHVEVPLAHPARDHVRGRIWRIAAATEDARSSRAPKIAGAPVEELVSLLGHPNLTVRVLATEELAARDWRPSEAELFRDGASGGWCRAHLLWLVERLARAGLSAEAIERLADDRSACVRVHLMKALAERGDWEETATRAAQCDLASLVRRKLFDGDPFVRRAAAEALGRHPHVANVKPLLDLWRGVPADDTHLEHVVAMAVRDHFLLVPDLYSKLDPAITGDQEYDALLMRASAGAPGMVAIERQIDFLRTKRVVSEDAARLVESILPTASQAQVAELSGVVERLSGDYPLAEQATLLRLFGHAAEVRAVELPASTSEWCARVAAPLLESKVVSDVATAIELAENFKLSAARSALLRIARDGRRESNLRAKALAAAVAIDAEGAWQQALATLDDSTQSLFLRQAAASALGRGGRARAREELAKRLNVGPVSLAETVAAELASDRQGAKELLAAAGSSKWGRTLLASAVVRERLAVVTPAEAGASRPQATVSDDTANEEISRLIHARRESFLGAKHDARSGAGVFRRICGHCHALGGHGGGVGPALDAIGNRGIDRLFEDVLAPSRNVAPEYRASLVALIDGRTEFGRVLHQDIQGVSLADAHGTVRWLAAEEVDEIGQSSVSIMPANIADTLAEADFNDLLAFLLTQRTK